MGEVTNAFQERRKKQLENERSARYFGSVRKLYQKTILRTHYFALQTDIATALMVEVQRDVLGDEKVDDFLSVFCDFRELYATSPNDFVAEPWIEQILYEMTVSKGGYDYDVTFNQMASHCEGYLVVEGDKNHMVRSLLSQAKNTSNGLQLFQEWCKTGENSQRILETAKRYMALGNATYHAHDFAKGFIEEFVTVSRPSIDLNTKQAKEKDRQRIIDNVTRVKNKGKYLHLVK